MRADLKILDREKSALDFHHEMARPYDSDRIPRLRIDVAQLVGKQTVAASQLATDGVGDLLRQLRLGAIRTVVANSVEQGQDLVAADKRAVGELRPRYD